jgi:hypothetical protein
MQRCIPILRELWGAELWCGLRHSKELLKTDFSFLTYLDLDGYGVSYSTQGGSLP